MPGLPALLERYKRNGTHTSLGAYIVLAKTGFPSAPLIWSLQVFLMSETTLAGIGT